MDAFSYIHPKLFFSHILAEDAEISYKKSLVSNIFNFQQQIRIPQSWFRTRTI